MLFSGAVLLFGSVSFAYDDGDQGGSDPEEKARKAHELAASDMIYQQEEWKALYYQNMEIIDILKQIRDSLDTIKMRDVKNTEGKTQ